MGLAGPMGPAGVPKRAFLVWDPGFGGRFALSLAGLLAAGLCGARVDAVSGLAWEAYQEVLFRLMEGANRMAWWSVVGLLSSSCCALQLALNAVNFGCAGFNSVLGPLRPALCALTVCLQAAVWHTAWDRPFQRRYAALGTLLAAALTLLPELTALRLRSRAQRAAPVGAQSRAMVSVEGMGCVACAQKVAELVGASPVVVSHEVSFEQKEVCIILSADPAEAKSVLVPELLRLIDKAGFEAKISSICTVASKEALLMQDAGAGAGELPGSGAPAACCGGSATGLPLSIGAGLLSSSCCLLQLGVNMLATFNAAHIGCAGFNKFLGPWRTTLRLLTGTWLAASWGLCWWRRWPRRFTWRLALQTLLCLALTFLPEALLHFGGPALAPSADGAEVIHLKVAGMGCEACQMHVQGVMERAGGVLASSVDFKAGHAELLINRGWAFDLQGLARRLEEDGYSASLRTDL